MADAVWSQAATTILAASIGALVGTATFGVEPPAEKTTHIAEVAPKPEPTNETLAAGAGRALLEELPIGIIVVADPGSVEFANRSALEMFGLSRSVGAHVSVFRVPRLLEAIELALRHRASSDLTIMVSRHSERHLDIQVRPLSPTGRLSRSRAEALVVLEDRTEARVAQAIHRDFVANASHELKTPLAAISGIIETLQGHAKEDPGATERFLGIMSSQTARMARLVQDLLSLNRIEVNERVAPSEPLDLGRLVAEICDSQSPMAEAQGMRLVLRESEESIIVLGDSGELSQLFRNLIDNATKYGRRDTDIRVGFRRDDTDRRGMIGVFIADKGIGIAREHIPRLTERFYRVSVSRSRERGGTGLGLAIVKHIINRHRGDLSIESTPNEGSEFVVWLPIHVPKEGHDQSRGKYLRAVDAA